LAGAFLAGAVFFEEAFFGGACSAACPAPCHTPISAPCGSRKTASQPMPGTSIFGTTIVAPWAAALATVWSTSSTPT
jgi:hypothetical protein